MNLKVKTALQTICLSGVLAIAAVSAFSQPSHAVDPASKVEVCPTGSGNCAVDTTTGQKYDHISQDQALSPQ